MPFFLDKTQGVSSLILCVMIDESERLKENCVKNVANILHSLTYTYKNFDSTNYDGPRINVLFTNFSK